jgi:secondary thiamine-phosphate synthase enzyme
VQNGQSQAIGGSINLTGLSHRTEVQRRGRIKESSWVSMMTFEASCLARTEDLYDFVDITDDVQSAVAGAGVEGGRATVFSPSDLCPLLVNERESGLLKDIRRAVDRVTAHGQLQAPSTIGSKSVVFPIVEGKLRLGTWQRILLLELEKPSDRKVLIQIVGE